jgi:hypothetical protein
VHLGISAARRRATDDELAVRKLTYEQAAGERDRIRSARAFFARQLGPLPAFAGISVALVGALSEKFDEGWQFWAALACLVGMLAVSFGYSRMPPYRELRADRVRKATKEGRDALTPAAWYGYEIELERRIYGTGDERTRLWWLPLRKVEGSLAEQLDKERIGLFVAQGLFLAAIVLLLFAR